MTCFSKIIIPVQSSHANGRCKPTYTNAARLSPNRCDRRGEFWPRVNPLREEIAAAFETLTHTQSW